MSKGLSMDVFEFQYNLHYYYFNEKIAVLKTFEEIHMAKVVFIESERESIVDISGISRQPITDISIPITLLGGGMK